MKTSYYGNKNLPPDVTAVRISRGAPRWKTGYKIAGAVRELMPDRDIMGLPEAEFYTRYTAALDAAGVDAIRAALAPFGDHAVLMCFESLKNGSWCHRRMFADWWEALTGEKITEF